MIAGAINDGAAVENCKVENCTVIGTKKVGSVVGYTFNSSVTGCSATDCVVYCADTSTTESGEIVGFVNTGSTVNNNTHNNVTVNRGVTAVTSAAELTAAVAKNTANVNVVLMNDITMSAKWTPIDIGFYGDYTNVKKLTINGNGHTISGLTSALVEKVSANCEVTIKNLTVKGAAISNSSYTNGMGNGILVGYVENGAVTLENCYVADSEISESSGAAAALIGYIANDSSTTNNSIVISNCTVKNTVVSGDSAAGFVGYAQGANITVSGCEVSGSTFTGEKAEKQGAYFGTVNVGTTANISNTTADITALVGRILSDGAVNYN